MVASHLAFSRRFDVYYFRATKNMRPRRFRYRSQSKQTSREVFRGYANKKVPGEMAYYRHAAFHGHFVRCGEIWHLEVVPTYFFTYDGQRRSRLSGKLLAGIKRLEHNENVRNQLLMWAAFLSRPPTLYDQEYPYLAFGKLRGFDVLKGIDDAAWLPPEVKKEDDQIEADGCWTDGELFS
jgi:hypothetical protein